MTEPTKVMTPAANGVGFSGLLTIVFIALKLTGSITWSWVWVLSPIWISALGWLMILVLGIVILWLAEQ